MMFGCSICCALTGCCPKAGMFCHCRDSDTARKGDEKMSYMTVGTLQAFEALMVEKPGFNHYDSGIFAM